MPFDPHDLRGDAQAHARSTISRKFASLGRIGFGGVLVALVLGWIAVTTLYPRSRPHHVVDSGVAVGTTGNLERTPAEARRVDFIHTVMNDAQDAWRVLLPSDYQPPRVVLFRDAIDAACGALRAATGPFYCPGDERVYLDLGFLEELRDRFGALGDFAPAYVIAHDRMLAELVEKRPRTLGDLAAVKGFGASRIEQYGEGFLAVINGD